MRWEVGSEKSEVGGRRKALRVLAINTTGSQENDGLMLSTCAEVMKNLCRDGCKPSLHKFFITSVHK
jgi:hypothetical protein